jgi:hypothetical protein
VTPPLGALLGVRVVAVALALLFPEGGSQPYSTGTLLSIVLCCALMLWLLPRLDVPRPGFTLVRLRFTPYWSIARGHGCVMRSADGWTLVFAPRSGALSVRTRFDPRRLVTRHARCTRRPQKPASTL